MTTFINTVISVSSVSYLWEKPVWTCKRWLFIVFVIFGKVIPICPQDMSAGCSVFIIVSAFPEISCQSTWVRASTVETRISVLTNSTKSEVYFWFQLGFCPSVRCFFFSSKDFLRAELLEHKHAVCAVGPQPEPDPFTLTEPSAPVSLFCQPAKLEATVRFSYRKTSQERFGYKLTAGIRDFSFSTWCVHCQCWQFVIITLAS